MLKEVNRQKKRKKEKKSAKNIRKMIDEEKE